MNSSRALNKFKIQKWNLENNKFWNKVNCPPCIMWAAYDYCVGSRCQVYELFLEDFMEDSEFKAWGFSFL